MISDCDKAIVALLISYCSLESYMTKESYSSVLFFLGGDPSDDAGGLLSFDLFAVPAGGARAVSVAQCRLATSSSSVNLLRSPSSFLRNSIRSSCSIISHLCLSLAFK